MKTGIVIFAHNSRKVDYSLMSLISGGLAKKHLKIPVSLITDQSTIEWINKSQSMQKFNNVFENIILTDRPSAENYRNLNDGELVDNVPFVNGNRSSVWHLTPYDKTLLIDSDYFIFSERLKPYIESDHDIMISSAMNDLGENRAGTLDKYVSDTGPNLYWATNVIFKKNKNSKIFFDLVDFIKDNYYYYAELFRFYPKPYRNDIAFSIAKHILDGFSLDLEGSLPPISTTIDRDILVEVSDKGRLKFLMNQGSDYVAMSIENTDIHVMNKQSIIRHKESLLELI